jgi:hypothetical protein
MIKKKQKSVKGISLIVLVITIIVIIIIAGAVIISLINSNVINNANEAAFKSNVDQYKSELSLWVAKQYTDTQGSFDKTTADYTGQQAKDAKIVSFKAGDESKFKIVDGELVIVTEAVSEKEKTWFTMASTSSDNSENNTSNQNVVTTPTVIPVDEATAGTPLTASASVSGKAYSYNNPIIPAGFYPVNTTDASWNLENGVPKGWDNGLVIKDSSGNEFVWVPVDGINVIYAKWSSKSSNNQYFGVQDIELPASVSTERFQIAKYRGFYVGRFEVAYGTGGAAEIKKGKTVYLASFFPAKTCVEKMSTQYNYVEVKSGIITETQWDTLMLWLENSGVDTTRNYASWGNATGTPKSTGNNDAWKKKNIYDLSGNSMEMTNGVNNGNVSYRDASSIASNSNPYRGYSSLASRAALFIL